MWSLKFPIASVIMAAVALKAYTHSCAGLEDYDAMLADDFVHLRVDIQTLEDSKERVDNYFKRKLWARHCASGHNR